MTERPHKGACDSCGGDMTDGQLRRQEFALRGEIRTGQELDEIREGVRSVVNMLTATGFETLRRQLIALLPEARRMPADLEARMRSGDMASLVDLHNERVVQAWRDYGFDPPETDADE